MWSTSMDMKICGWPHMRCDVLCKEFLSLALSLVVDLFWISSQRDPKI